MSLSELFPQIHVLPRSEKWRLVQLMLADLAREENALTIEADESYPVWSPYEAFDAADTMLRVLKEESGK